MPTEAFTDPNALQLAVMARLNLLGYSSIQNTSPTGFTAPMNDDAAMNAVALYVTTLNSAKAAGSGFDAELIDRAVREMYEAVVEAERLWPKAGYHAVPRSQVDAHVAAITKVQEVAQRYGFNAREGYLLAHPEQRG